MGIIVVVQLPESLAIGPGANDEFVVRCRPFARQWFVTHHTLINARALRVLRPGCSFSQFYCTEICQSLARAGHPRREFLDQVDCRAV
jgi:hypothetical protein